MRYRRQQYNLPQDKQACLTFEQFNVLNNVISLWQRFSMWRWVLFLSKLEQSPYVSAVEKRINQVPVDFYNTLRVFFGERLAEQFLATFQSYVMIQTKLMDDLISRNQESVDTLTQSLYAKADEIAALLSKFPYWQQEQWKSLLYQDISASLADYRAALSGDYEMEISIYERILLNASEIGQYMARGIFYAGKDPILLWR